MCATRSGYHVQDLDLQWRRLRRPRRVDRCEALGQVQRRVPGAQEWRRRTRRFPQHHSTNSHSRQRQRASVGDHYEHQIADVNHVGWDGCRTVLRDVLSLGFGVSQDYSCEVSDSTAYEYTFSSGVIGEVGFTALLSCKDGKLSQNPYDRIHLQGWNTGLLSSEGTYDQTCGDTTFGTSQQTVCVPYREDGKIEGIYDAIVRN